MGRKEELNLFFPTVKGNTHAENPFNKYLWLIQVAWYKSKFYF